MKLDLYFKEKDSTTCYPLEDYINEAKEEGLTEIELIEAIPELDNSEYTWCTYYGDIVEKQECRKSICTHWDRYKKSNICANRGKLFRYGKKVKISINKTQVAG